MTDVTALTPLAASVLFGRALEAVRVATVQGHVRTSAVVQFGKHPVRLIELASCVAYWGALDDARTVELDSMKRGAVVLDVGLAKLEVLHPGSLVMLEPACPHDNPWPCTESPCSPMWFRW